MKQFNARSSLPGTSRGSLLSMPPCFDILRTLCVSRRVGCVIAISCFSFPSYESIIEPGKDRSSLCLFLGCHIFSILVNMFLFMYSCLVPIRKALPLLSASRKLNSRIYVMVNQKGNHNIISRN